MREDSPVMWAELRGEWSHRARLVRLALALLLATLYLLLSGSAAEGRNEVPWRNLEVAEQQLADARAAVDDIDAAILDAESQLASTTATISFLDASEGDRADALLAWRQRARQLAIETYIHGGPGGLSVQLLDTATASDLTWQTVLLREQTEAAHNASEIYEQLIAESPDDLVMRIDDIDGIQRRIEGLEIDRVRALDRIDEAEWVVEIAEIHAEAERELERTGRRDPTLEDWNELAFCESTNTYDINTGNGFFGAYQFDYQTWFTVGGEPGTRADQAPPEEQDARARLLFARRGSQPWPVCGRYLDS